MDSDFIDEEFVFGKDVEKIKKKKEIILDCLKSVIDPDLKKNIVELNFVRNLKINEKENGKYVVEFDLNLTTPACPVKDELLAECKQKLTMYEWIQDTYINTTFIYLNQNDVFDEEEKKAKKKKKKIENIILVYSCKGGVGKSFFSVNFSFYLKKKGASVGLLDADINGPSLPTLLPFERTYAKFKSVKRKTNKIFYESERRNSKHEQAHLFKREENHDKYDNHDNRDKYDNHDNQTLHHIHEPKQQDQGYKESVKLQRKQGTHPSDFTVSNDRTDTNAIFELDNTFTGSHIYSQKNYAHSNYRGEEGRSPSPRGKKEKQNLANVSVQNGMRVGEAVDAGEVSEVGKVNEANEARDAEMHDDCEERPLLIEPLLYKDVKLMSYSYIKNKKNLGFSSFRGPVLNELIKEFINNVDWGILDYLIIDMPPGTNDIHLNLFESEHIDGVIMITTPNDLSINDVKKGINMCTYFNIPIIGLIINMNSFICDSCEKRHQLFNNCDLTELKGTINNVYEIPFHSLFSKNVYYNNETEEKTFPFILSFEKHYLIDTLECIFQAITREISMQKFHHTLNLPSIEIYKKYYIQLSFDSIENKFVFSDDVFICHVKDVRLKCTCDICKTSEKKKKKKKIIQNSNLHVKEIVKLGIYNVKIVWSDMHISVYSYAYLKHIFQKKRLSSHTSYCHTARNATLEW
ncbi:hypothetical protein, conserved [Plasmodium gonderi]|uniref:Fe-S cluster assembly protein n=1 Tax=Plasmodium gonderi TaxID=77519 RepID=A0A1Y1JI62_PLAGO|nr:hypothetical protein, conserved [Plasmodium gonderi]GAW81055.1 hypothetical protein, conserved [Plasmodium gonderi]